MDPRTTRAIWRRPGAIALAGLVLGIASLALYVSSARSGDALELCVSRVLCIESAAPTDCTDAGFDGARSLKVEDPPMGSSGPYTDGTLAVRITVTEQSLGQVVDWTADKPVRGVIVKGGPTSNVYTDPEPSTSGTGMHAPVNDRTSRYYDISHVIFCAGPGPTPTTPPKPTATPTPAPTPTPTTPAEPTPTPATPTPATPTISPTRTASPTPSATAAPASPTAGTPSQATPRSDVGAASGSNLPRTGASVLGLAAVGLLLVAAGLRLTDMRSGR